MANANSPTTQARAMTQTHARRLTHVPGEHAPARPLPDAMTITPAQKTTPIQPPASVSIRRLSATTQAYAPAMNVTRRPVVTIQTIPLRCVMT